MVILIHPSKNLDASMEPSSVEDGNWAERGGWPLTDAALQWSRPQLRTETGCSDDEIVRRINRFNGAVLS